ncbi:MAG: Lrp/AsnC family transcriptional regulator [Actinomycetota bacterium]
MPTDEVTPLDPTDRRIIDLLIDDARQSVAAIAEAVHLSRSATSDRVRRLERDGWITGYRAEVSPEVSGRTLEAVVGIRMRGDADREAVEGWLADHPAVTEAVHLTGPDNYLVRFLCLGTQELDEVLMTMKSDAGVAATETRIVLRRLPVSG